MNQFSAFVCGWVFAIGLGVSGMTKPSKHKVGQFIL